METYYITCRSRDGQGQANELVEADLFMEVGDWLEFLERPEDGPARVVRILRRSEVASVRPAAERDPA